MVFSSPVFLFLFLPAVLALYFAGPVGLRNGVLLVTSVLFYAWGEPAFVLVMLAAIGVNYAAGLWVDRMRGRPGGRAVLALAVTANVGLLVVYKYLNFVVDNLNVVLATVGVSPIVVGHVALPVGISFFTFHTLSYLIDVARRDAPVARNPVAFALYVTLFPQLVAGPIVRYRHVAHQIVARTVSLPGFALGVRRFGIGLGKKVLVANTLAVPADAIFGLPASELTPAVAWLGVVAYALQIYFDFSGYSDMAIGLGHMFGFRFLENFDYPYVSRSLTEFWRRWHISLATWFRDYLYIPLGGGRTTPLRVYRNLFVVFALCGIWHGASWSFLCWGLYHGLFLVLERGGGGGWLARLPAALQHGYAVLVILGGWVLFRASDLAAAGSMLAAMAGRGAATEYDLGMYLDPGVAAMLAVGVIGSLPVLPALGRRVAQAESAGLRQLAGVAGTLAIAVIVLASAVMLAVGTHNPFIYFRF